MIRPKKKVLGKLWGLGNIQHENVAIHSNHKTVYEGADSNPGYLYKFVADTAQDLRSGRLFVYKGSKSGNGEWLELNNITPEDHNSTLAQSDSLDATVFDGIEDVEIGPDSLIYFAVKGEGSVYRFKDSDPLTGTIVTEFETFVGDTSYVITHKNGSTLTPFGSGADNLAFDNKGNLWVMQDGDNNYIWVVGANHTQEVPDVRIFGQTPDAAEPTGITFTPDNKFMFMSVQHPSVYNDETFQYDASGQKITFEYNTAIAISLSENLATSAKSLSIKNKVHHISNGLFTYDLKSEKLNVSYEYYLMNGSLLKSESFDKIREVKIKALSERAIIVIKSNDSILETFTVYFN